MPFDKATSNVLLHASGVYTVGDAVVVEVAAGVTVVISADVAAAVTVVISADVADGVTVVISVDVVVFD